MKTFARKGLDMLLGRQIVQGDEIEEFWALKDVSFQVNEGEVVGIIGRNGAGKSTLLKILSRITEPTAGRLTLRGRVASLLEVGTGFHPELTGRENIFLNGAILGMTRREIITKFDEIVAFAGVDRFLDTPVKRYSSGMYVRLAFAVAAHLEPEILIVDEVLAVGDSEFQKKCLGKMQDVATGGRTVLIVSHNLGLVSQLCSKCIVLQGGKVLADGPTNESINCLVEGALGGNTFERIAEAKGASVFVNSATISLDQVDRLVSTISIRSEIQVPVSIDLRITDAMGVPIVFTGVGCFNKREELLLSPGSQVFRIETDISSLGNGSYMLSIDIADPTVGYFDRLDSVLSFEIDRKPSEGSYRRLEQKWMLGSIHLPSSLA